MKNFICGLFTTISFAQAGSFDMSYGTNGIAASCYIPTGQMDMVIDACFQSSGKILTYGIVNEASVASIIRWNTDGSIDTTFGDAGTGVQSYSVGAPFVNGGYNPYQFAVQADDKIVIMGFQRNDTYLNAYWVARLLPNGALDTSFNGTGYLDLSFGTQQDRGRCIAIQNDGKILVGGTSGNAAEYFSVARLNPDGSLDTGFGIGGKVQTPFTGNESFAQSIVVQPDNKIILGGYTVNAPHAKDFALARYNTNGTLDTGFGINGKVITTIGNNSDLITQLSVQPDGKIVAGGYTSSENFPWMCLVRYMPNGAIDTSFGVNGIVINNDDNSRNCTIARQNDGKYLIAGCVDGIYFLIIRYNTDGTKDTSFGMNGVVNAFPATYGAAIKVLIQPDNKIVACGGTNSTDFLQQCYAIVRMNPGTLGINETLPLDLKLFPNPTTGAVRFDNSDYKINSVLVFDSLGQKILTRTDYNQNISTVDLTSLASGIYFLQLEGPRGISKAKVVKE